MKCGWATYEVNEPIKCKRNSHDIQIKYKQNLYKIRMKYGWLTHTCSAYIIHHGYINISDLQ